MERSLQRAGLGSLAANIAFSVLKIATGSAGQSVALVADGIESLADVLSSLVVWKGLGIGARAPDQDHPYGHGKAESLAGLVASGALLLSAVVIAATALSGLLRPQTQPAFFTLPVLAAIILCKEGLFRWLRQRSRLWDCTVLEVEAWHHRSDALTSLGVLLGVAIAVLGGPAYAIADEIAALAVSGLIFWNGFRLMRPSIDELMDRQVEDLRVDEIRAHAARIDGIVRLETIDIRKSGRDFLVDIHLEVDGAMTVAAGHQLAHDLRFALENDPALRIRRVNTHVEPSDSAPR